MKAVNRDDFFVEDEPLEDVEAALAAGRPVVTSRTARGARTTGAKFELKETKNGQFLFNLKAANGTVIATSEQYATKAAALRGIDAVRAAAADAEIESTVG